MRVEDKQISCKFIGEKIRFRRKQLGLSLSEVAEAMGISATQLHKYEQGKNTIDCVKIMQLASFLEVPVSNFLTEQSEREGDKWPKLKARFGKLKHEKLQDFVIHLTDKVCELDSLMV